MMNNNSSIFHYENKDDFELEILQDDIDMSNIDYYESDDDEQYDSNQKYMESTPVKQNGSNKFKFDQKDFVDFEMEDFITFEFTETSQMEADKVSRATTFFVPCYRVYLFQYVNGVNVSQLSVNASLSRFAATYPSQSKSHSLSISSSQY